MRIADWQTELTNLINNAREKEFDFSRHNCLFFALQAIDAQTDSKLISKYKKLAGSPQIAAKNLRQVEDVKNCQELLHKILGGELHPIAFARPGDIVFSDKAHEEFAITQNDLFGPTPGVCYGMTSYFLGEFGTVEVPTMMLDSALWVS